MTRTSVTRPGRWDGHDGPLADRWTPVEWWVDSPATDSTAGSTTFGLTAGRTDWKHTTHDTRHTMNQKTRKFGGLFMVLALTIAAVSGVVMAAPGSIDTSPPSDTSEQVYIQDNKTLQTGFEANGSISYGLPVLNATGASADDLAMNVTHDGVEYYKFTGSWDTYQSGESDTSTDYIHNFTGDDLSDVPMNINENVTLTVTYWNQSASSPTPTEYTVYIENGDVRSVQRVTESSAPADVDEDVEPPAYRPLSDAYDVASVDDTVSVNNSSTDVTYTLSDTNMSDPWDNRTEDLSSGGFMLTIASVDADEEADIPMFYKSAPDWYDSDDMGSYAVYDDGDDTVTFKTADTEFDGASSADLAFSSDVYRGSDIGTVWDLAGGYSGAGTDAIMNMVL